MSYETSIMVNNRRDNLCFSVIIAVRKIMGHKFLKIEFWGLYEKGEF